MKKRIFALVAAGLSIFLLACGAQHAPKTGPSTNSAGSAEEEREPAGTLKPGKACYQLACISTVEAATANAGNDFKYPDNKNYSDPILRPQYRAPTHYLDLSTADLKTKIAPNFTLGEFVSPKKGRYAVLLPIVVSKIQAIRDSFGSAVVVTSGYRSPGYNSRTDGAATWSRHIYGDAIDIGASSQSKLEKECHAKNASFVLSYSDGHVHCDWRKVDLDPSFYAPITRDPTLPSLAFFALTAQLNKELKIGIAGTKLYVSLPDSLDLDEGEPTYKWTVKSPDGVTFVDYNSHLELPPQAPRGTYQVEVVVGNSLRATETLEW